jgi:hypothetical protein
MSMLNFHINRGGKGLPASRRAHASTPGLI